MWEAIVTFFTSRLTEFPGPGLNDMLQLGFNPATYKYGPFYGPTDNPGGVHVLVPWNVAVLTGAAKHWPRAIAAGEEGVQAAVFMVDSGVDLHSSFFKRFSDPVWPFGCGVSFKSTRFKFTNVPDPFGIGVHYDDNNPALSTDYLGHGTMTASAVLAMNPVSEIVMVHPSITDISDDEHLTMGLCGVGDFLIALGRIVALVRDRTKRGLPSVVNISQGFSLAGGSDLVAEDAHRMLAVTVESLIQRIVLWRAPVTAAAGNSQQDRLLVPGHLPSVTSVGGAYPGKVLDTPSRLQEWYVSNYSLAGKAGWDSVLKLPHWEDRPFPDLCGFSGGHFLPKGGPPWYVYLCHPVSIGLSVEELKVAFPLPSVFHGHELLYWLLLLVNDRLPMDFSAKAAYGDPSGESDGWAMTPGMTSYGSAVVAGALSLVSADAQRRSGKFLLDLMGGTIELLIMELANSCTRVCHGHTAAPYQQYFDKPNYYRPRGKELSLGEERDPATGWGVVGIDVFMYEVDRRIALLQGPQQ
jgi:hypothetical protein